MVSSKIPSDLQIANFDEVLSLAKHSQTESTHQQSTRSKSEDEISKLKLRIHKLLNNLDNIENNLAQLESLNNIKTLNLEQELSNWHFFIDDIIPTASLSDIEAALKPITRSNISITMKKGEDKIEDQACL